jgi:hypothetical protein
MGAQQSQSVTGISKECPDENAIKNNKICRNFLLNKENIGKFDADMSQYCDKPENFDDSICICLNSKSHCPQDNEKNCKNGLGYMAKSMIRSCPVCVQQLDQKNNLLSFAEITQVCDGNAPTTEKPSYNIYLFIFLIILVIIIAVIFVKYKFTKKHETTSEIK